MSPLLAIAQTFAFRGSPHRHTMHWQTVMLLLTNYFVQQRYTRNVIFLNCMDKNGELFLLLDLCVSGRSAANFQHYV